MSVSIVWVRLPAPAGRPTVVAPARPKADPEVPDYWSTRAGSMRMPGPMVDDTDTFLR